MTISDLINAHGNPAAMVACFVQIMAAFFVLFATADQNSLSPYFPWLGRWRQPARVAVRLVICMGWIGVIFGAAMSASGIGSQLMGWSSAPMSEAQNDFGVLVSRLSGAVVLPHVTFITWKLVTVWVACGFRRPSWPLTETNDAPPETGAGRPGASTANAADKGGAGHDQGQNREG